MKKYLFLCALLFACFAESSFAQLQVSNPLAKKEPLLKIPMAHITTVESRFVPVHINVVKPVVVSLPPLVFGKHDNAACAHFKKLKATLILQAERANDVVANLHWETKYAFYATGFDVERSLGDSLHFLTVNFAAVSTATNFKIDYHLPDRNDYSGISFYRIKQHDGDTSFVYSNIISIKGYEATTFKVYPIPSRDKVWIDVLPKQSGNIAIMVYDPTGRLVQQVPVSCTGDMHAVKSIDVSKLAAGVYQIKIVMPDKSILNGKFIRK